MNQYTPSGFSLQIFKDRYALHENETFDDACRRVANFIASAEDGQKVSEMSERFYNILASNKFSPGGRIWRGSGRTKGQLLNCFILDDDRDSREGWGDLLRSVLIISGTGGGVGINFSKIRPRGAPIKGTGGVSTGSVSLMKMLNAVCNELREGGARRSASLYSLSVYHPDLPEFLSVKLDKNELVNANISVLIDTKFIDLVKSGGMVEFMWGDKKYGEMQARDIWDKIIENSLKTGDPGLLNLEFAESESTISYISPLVSTNPCGEVFASSNECCDLGAIVLPSHIKNGNIDWAALDDTIRLGVRFLDNVLDKNYYPLPEIEKRSKELRRIGLGIMGLHDAMLMCGIKYSSHKAVEFTDEIMSFLKKKAYDASIFLSVEKGQFPLLNRDHHINTGFCKRRLPPSIRKKIHEYGIRNSNILLIAPTGTTSIVAGCSSGIEPIFAPVYRRNFNKHKDVHSEMVNKSSEIVVHPLLEKFIRNGKDTSHFESAHDITPGQHCEIQRVCQLHVDQSISKTINLPSTARPSDLSNIMMEYLPRLKGMTIYKDGSKGNAPLEILDISDAKKYLDQCAVQIYDSSCLGGKCEI